VTPDREQDLDDELRSHLEMHVADNIRAGMSPHEARRRAVLALGGFEQTKEQYREGRHLRIFEEFVQDVRFGGRTLVKHKTAAAAIVVILALVTGAMTAIFSVVNGVLLQPLPFTDPDRLVEVSLSVPASELDAVKSDSFERFTSFNPSTKHLRGEGNAERLRTISTDREFFATLGVLAATGRTFGRDDAQPVAVLSGRFWSRRFNRDPAILGRPLILDDVVFTVVGVMPDAFQFPYSAASIIGSALPESQTDVWLVESQQPRRGTVRTLTARLRSGVTPDQAAAEWTLVQNRIARSRPERSRTRLEDVRVVPLADAVLAPVRRSLWLMFGAAVLPLVAACANVASLLLALASARLREVATRAALGASRGRLARQFLTESVLLSLIGGAIGLVIARLGLSLIVGAVSEKIPRAQEIALNWHTFGFALSVCLLTAVIFGLAPAVMAARVDLRSVTKETGGHATASRKYGQVRDVLVVAEVALAFILALAVAVVMAELRRLRDADAGISTTNVVTLHLGQRTTPRTEARPYYDIADRVARISGVNAAGFTQALPLQNWGWTANTIDLTRAGRPPLEAPAPFLIELRYVTPGYFDALGIPVLSGRPLTEADTRDTPRVIVINQTLARRYFGGVDPVGVETTRGTIVGIVGDVRQVNLDEPAVPELYYPMAQNWTQLSDLGMTLVVRTDRRPEPLVDAIRSAIRHVAPGVAIFNVKTMDEVIADSLWDLNLYRWLVGLFAVLTLALAAVGLYGVISYGVAVRRREWAVRLALGSDPVALARLVLKRGLQLSVIGIMVGIIGALATWLTVPDLPVSFSAGPATFATISTLLLTIGFIACFFPAMRAARSTPALALRQE
jgi:predicted permease